MSPSYAGRELDFICSPDLYPGLSTWYVIETAYIEKKNCVLVFKRHGNFFFPQKASFGKFRKFKIIIFSCKKIKFKQVTEGL